MSLWNSKYRLKAVCAYCVRVVDEWSYKIKCSKCHIQCNSSFIRFLEPFINFQISKSIAIHRIFDDGYKKSSNSTKNPVRQVQNTKKLDCFDKKWISIELSPKNILVLFIFRVSVWRIVAAVVGLVIVAVSSKNIS